MSGRLYMAITFVESEYTLRRTGIGARGTTNRQTLAAFEAARAHEVSPEKARFLLDLMSPKDNILTTVLLDRRGFSAVTGRRPRSAREYAQGEHRYYARMGRTLPAVTS